MFDPSSIHRIETQIILPMVFKHRSIHSLLSDDAWSDDSKCSVLGETEQLRSIFMLYAVDIRRIKHVRRVVDIIQLDR